MPDQLQLRGGTTVQHSTFTGASKEVTIDTTKKTAVVHDGSTAGGNPLMREDGSNSSLALGSAGSPSLKWDANTGLYSPGADQVAISTNGTGRLFVDASGKLGVGTSSPGEKLVLAESGATAVYQQFTNNASANIGYIGLSSSGNYALQCNNNILFNAGPSYTERLRITSDGKLGLGSSAPPSILTVNGTDPLITFQNAATNRWQLGYENTNSHRFVLYDTNAAAYRLVVDSSGRVGVGTTSPAGGASNFIDVYGSASSTVNFHNATSGTASNDGGVVGQYGSDLVLYNYENGILQFGTNNAERARIDSSGRLLVGTANASSDERLNVTYAPANRGIIVNTSSAFAGNSQLIEFRANGTVGGSITFTNNGTSTAFVGSSDYRLKENIVALDSGISRLLQLKPKRFNFIADPDNIVDGFIAHEAQEVVPQAVTGSKDEVDNNGNPIYQGIDQSKLVPLLTAALQEAIGEIESVKVRVSALETP